MPHANEMLQQNLQSLCLIQLWSHLRNKEVRFYSGKRMYGVRMHDECTIIVSPSKRLGMYGGKRDDAVSADQATTLTEADLEHIGYVFATAQLFLVRDLTSGTVETIDRWDLLSLIDKDRSKNPVLYMPEEQIETIEPAHVVSLTDPYA